MSKSSVSVSSLEENVVISSSSSSISDREYPLPVGWYTRLPGLQEPANYGTKYETKIYEEQVKSGYRLPLHPFALRFFEHYHMAPGQLVPNRWRKLVGLIYLVQTLGYKPDATDFMKVFFEIWFIKGVANSPGWYYIHSRQRLLKGGPKSNKGWHSRYFFVGSSDKGKLPFDREWNPYFGAVTPPPAHTISSTFPAESASLEMASGSGKAAQGGFLGIVEKVSVEEDPIFRPIWTLRSDDVGMPDSQISEQHFVHGVLPRNKEIFQNQTHETFACSFAQAVYTLSKQETEYLAQIKTLEKRLERAKRRAAEEVKKARDQGIPNFLDGNAEDELLKKHADDGLEIYELGFAKAKEMFAERFPDIPLDNFILPALISLSRETVLPSEAGDAAASHPPGDGPSGDAPEP
ncbi:hypothetical protein RJ639_030681 [Escallonia herrerae]|uniref:Transposase (putative) gypsy type domain-containing protein n=1 Tax=Escallonia herrerae TaxID=1293975 RepID=A0AA88X1P9_9ASTE|nr:hypothetical protein RJ639_030681 [Escallonia herrerae]